MQATLLNYRFQQGRLRIPPLGLLAGGTMATAFAWLLNNTPSVAQGQTVIMLVFLLVDTITGVIAAALAKRVSSHRMRTRFIAKCAQYTCLVVLAAAPSLLLKNWLPIECAFSALIMFESVSIVENMRRLEIVGGVNLGPAKPLMGWLSKFLEIPDPASLPVPRTVLTPQEATQEKEHTL
jgi:toxin secretion/phage lysis holin